MNETLKNIFYFFFAILIAKIIGVLKSFWLAKILEPSDYGIWITILLISSYAPIICLGTVEALLKQVPFYIGKGEYNSASEVENGVFSTLIITASLTIIVGFTFHFFIPSEELLNVIILIRLMVISAVINFFSAYFYHRFAAYQNFKIVSIIDTVRAFLILLLQVSFGYIWGLIGALLGYLVCEIIVFFISMILSFSLYGNVSFSFKYNYIKRLIRIGFPITIVWWIFTLQTTVDRLICISMLGKIATGYYGLGVAIMSVFILIPQAIGKVLYPKINERYGQTENKNDLIPLVLNPTYILSIFVPLIISIIIFLLPIAYKVILPKYSRGLRSAQILIFGSFFSSFILNGANYLIATNNQYKFIKSVLYSLLFNIVGNITFVKLGFNIEGIALSTSLSGVFLTTLILWYVFDDIEYDKNTKFFEIIHVYFPFFIFISTMLVCNLFIPGYFYETSITLFFNFLLTILISYTTFLIIPFYRRKIFFLLKAFKVAISKKIL